MILFYDDWKKYPNAIIDYNTPNKSFLRLAGLYKSMGIKNHAFILQLHNPLLQGVDPFDLNLSIEQMAMIAEECQVNPFYFYREVIRIIASGNPNPIRIEANRGNIALWWLFYNHITTLLIQCRQTGKSLSMDCLANHIRCIGSTNTDMLLLTKNNDLKVRNIQRLKDLQSNLPYYLNLKTREDSDNTEKLTCVALNNTQYTAVGQMSEEGARKVGRGMTLAIVMIDEIAYVSGIRTILSSLLAGSNAARQSAKESGSLYGNIFATTAGYLSTDSGRFVYDTIYKQSFRWTEKLFDCKNEEDLVETIKKNTPRGRVQVLCEFSHRQLGKSDEWLRERINNAMAEGEDAGADFLNIWATGNETSPLSKEVINKITDSKVNDPYTEIGDNGYITNWYIPEQEVLSGIKNRKLVMGMDTSEAIGNDDITKVILDAETGEVVATGIYNETNIIMFSQWLAKFLIKYPTVTLIIEKRSTGITIVDNLILILLEYGIDPFKRIFNFVVNDAMDNKNYREEVLDRNMNFRDPEVYIKYRKLFGYATSGVGRTSRDNLYSTSLKSSTKYLGHLIRDKTLISQLLGLVYRNGRIDHAVGGHDDMVIAYTMVHWMLTHGKNLSYYGIDSNRILTTVSKAMILEQGGVDKVREKERQMNIKYQIEEMIEDMRNEKNPYIKDMMMVKIKKMYSGLDDSITNSFNLDSLLKDLKQNTYKR